MLKRLGKLIGGRDGRGGDVRLAVFGKHPGWDDHIEDFPLETEELAWVKRRLYAEGIATNIDSGAWERLDQAARTEGFRHLLVWRLPRGAVIGRLWSSRDGKGRSQYPMVVVAHCIGAPLDWSLEQVTRRLEWFEGKCVQSRDRAAVAEALARLGEDLHRAFSKLHDQRADAEGSDGATPAIADLAARPELGPGRVGLHRLMYEMEKELAPFRPLGPGGSTTRVRAASSAMSRSLRVPRCGDSPVASALLWSRFFASQLAEAVPVLLLLPMRHKWVDVIVGDPTPQQFFCLQAAEQAIPLTTDVPYTLDHDFTSRIDDMVRAANRT